MAEGEPKPNPYLDWKDSAKLLTEIKRLKKMQATTTDEIRQAEITATLSLVTEATRARSAAELEEALAAPAPGRGPGGPVGVELEMALMGAESNIS